MFNGDGKLEMFVSCGNCGAEGFISEDDDLKNIPDGGECKSCKDKDEEE